MGTSGHPGVAVGSFGDGREKEDEVKHYDQFEEEEHEPSKPTGPDASAPVPERGTHKRVMWPPLYGVGSKPKPLTD